MAFMLVPPLANADTSSTLTVIGTSDVSDSGLIPNLIGPQFQQAYPQFTFKYIGTASGSAITSAETGSQGASALIVHAPTLENQFVAGGFSYQTSGTGPSTNPFGSAIWTNDFVLAGPTGDPAGVAANGATNIAQAFVDVATAGLAGKATFVSRGGTPGTTTEEHAIWADVNAAGLTPTGVTLCAVPASARRRPDPDQGGRGRQRRGLPGRRASERHRRHAAELVHDHRADPGPERDRRQCLHGPHVGHRRQQLLRAHRPRHLRLPGLRHRPGRIGPEPQDRHRWPAGRAPPRAARTR